MTHWQFWRPGEVLAHIDGVQPLLESWNARDDPAQVRLQAYLDDLEARLSPLPEDQPLFLQMEIDVGTPERVLHHCDLDNFLYPVVRRIGWQRFRLAAATKYAGGGSRIAVGIAGVQGCPPPGYWHFFWCRAGSGVEKPEWKQRTRAALAAEGPGVLPPGPVEAHMAWRCSRRRNWAWMWKPTADALGPLLGEPDPAKPFHPDDGRISHLSLHLTRDESEGHNVDVAVWLRSNRDTDGDRRERESAAATGRVIQRPAEEPGAPGVMASQAPSAGAGTIRIFKDDDAGYLRWLTAHPEGFVVNCNRSMSGAYQVLHRARCRTISGAPTAGTTWTRDYIKVCADQKAPLQQWVLGKTQNKPQVCRRCRS